MKQTINLGTAVDTGTGDYLRLGGQKINENFDEVYRKLGDGQTIQPSNLGIIYHDTSVDGSILNAELGQIYAINTAGTECTVNMPIMNERDVGKSITFIDPFGTWNLNGVKFVAGAGSSFGASNSVDVTMRYARTVMTFITPASWLFNPGQRLDQLSDIAEASRYVRYRKVEVDGQTDFTDIFPVRYNDSAIDVIVNGVDLYYGTSLTSESEFGSIVPGSPDEIAQLNGFDIRLKHGASKGDIIKFVTYMKSTGTSPTSVEQHIVNLVNESNPIEEVPGQIIKKDLSNEYVDITLHEMGGAPTDQMNPDATNVFINGRRLVRRGDAGLPKGSCSITSFIEPDSCTAGGGEWTDSWIEYDLIMDQSSRLTTIRISTEVLDEDGENIVAVQTYNYILGTMTSLDAIVNETDFRYIRVTEPVTRKNKIYYTDVANPTNSTTEKVPGSETTLLNTQEKLFESIYPVGSLYFNAHNSANPKDFIGFGTWVRYGSGRAIVGWDHRTDALGNYDPVFGRNNNDVTANGEEQPSAGATRGSKTVLLQTSQIPLLKAAGKWLKKAIGGTGFFKNYGDLGGSNIDPVSSYNEADVEVGNDTPVEVNLIQPSITVYIWVRVE